MEVAHVVAGERGLVADGTQLGATYELRYRLDGVTLLLELVGQRSTEIELGDADFFDLAWSPLFNSLPVLQDRMLLGGRPRDYVMRWIDVPSLEATRSEQRYESLGGGVVRFSAGTFSADILFDDEGFVVEYPGLCRRV
jgi:uncharacterized protein